MNTSPVTEPLDEYEKLRCLDCGAAIWRYSTPEGQGVALEDVPGPWLIKGTKAHESDGNNGFRNHWDYCHTIARSLVTLPVTPEEFLWS